MAFFKEEDNCDLVFPELFITGWRKSMEIPRRFDLIFLVDNLAEELGLGDSEQDEDRLEQILHDYGSYDELIFVRLNMPH